MTIKSRFIGMVLAVIIIPVVSVIFIPTYFYLRSPHRVLMKGWKEISKSENFPIGKTESNELYKQLRYMPPDMEIAVFTVNGTILLSSIPELPAQQGIASSKVWETIASTRDEYFYQVMAPFAPTGTDENDILIEDILIVSRALREDIQNRKTRNRYFFLLPTIFMSIFSLVFIVSVIYIARAIFSSISVLDKKTKQIADGNLNTSLLELGLEAGVNKKPAKTDEIINLTKNLEKMRLKLLENEQRRTKFIMGISHDLRTPVAVIKGYTEALADDVMSNPADIKKSLDIISAKSSQLETMIDSLINFVKLSNNEWQQKLENVNLLSFIQEFAKSAEITGSLYKRTIKYDIDISPDIKVPMDRQLMQRTLENLSMNAFRYSKDGDSISIGAKENQNGAILITISDTGRGILEKDLPHIFDLFYRGTTSRREEGMGIGLAVVKQIIDLHGWQITVSSEEGKGTTFTIIIPNL